MPSEEVKQRIDRVKLILGDSFEEIYLQPIEAHLRTLILDDGQQKCMELAE